LIRFAPVQLFRVQRHIGVQAGQFVLLLFLPGHVMGDHHHAPGLVLSVSMGGGVAQQVGQLAGGVADGERIPGNRSP